MSENQTPTTTGQFYPAEVETRLRDEAAQIVSRYPQSRSALLPLLHLVQSEDGYVAPRGIGLCADILGLTRAEVSAVATFYSQYKRHPNGEYTVGVCTNALCAVMGGDMIWDKVSEHLGIGHDETTADGKISLEQLECNAACDYAPVVMVNWEFFDNQTPTSAIDLVDAIAAGQPVTPTRGAETVATFKEISHVLAGFEDGRADEGPAAGEATLLGLRIAREKGWTAPQLVDDTDVQPEAHEDVTEPSVDVAAAEEKAEEAMEERSSAERRTEPPESAVRPGEPKKSTEMKDDPEPGTGRDAGTATEDDQ
ncbi:NADH-quinone oxidoreductase subunit NuoE [Bogoriella caseilytica]|uniref:NADH dehydrogenase subunit E n=1 Tax=Bogoriella caseilytica TaxID=56055 RepID=A0A3N2BAW4_9MICO|nr:NADH-quinone oxidoreductase subunit NuoE [Bogoriella caseilytica]ROR72312.1 NADH dehydrogenase subunit E [Bogoriella caseilytica]